MNEMAARLAGHGINVMRFEFPYMAQRRLDGGKRPPNPAAKLLECWREVFATVRPYEIGRAHVCTPVTNAHLVCRLLLDKTKRIHNSTSTTQSNKHNKKLMYKK